MKAATVSLLLLVVGVAGKRYDPAYIHVGCSSEDGFQPEFYDNDDCNNSWNTTTGCPNGEGWYCNDGKDVATTTGGLTLDDAKIHQNCEAHAHYLHGSFEGGETWYCKDDGPLGWVDPEAYIHPDCSLPNFPVYRYDSDCGGGKCAFGKGWYCNDDQDVSGYALYQFDAAFITDGCKDDACDPDGQCVRFYDDIQVWLCNGDYDALISGEGGNNNNGNSYWRWLGPVLVIVAVAVVGGLAFWMVKRCSGDDDDVVDAFPVVVANAKPTDDDDPVVVAANVKSTDDDDEELSSSVEPSDYESSAYSSSAV